MLSAVSHELPDTVAASRFGVAWAGVEVAQNYERVVFDCACRFHNPVLAGDTDKGLLAMVRYPEPEYFVAIGGQTNVKAVRGC